MSGPEFIDRTWITAHGHGQLLCHADAAGWSQNMYRVVDRRSGRAIGLGFVDRARRPGRKGRPSDPPPGRRWFVDGVEGECADLDEALELLDLVRLSDARRGVERLPTGLPGLAVA